MGLWEQRGVDLIKNNERNNNNRLLKEQYQHKVLSSGSGALSRITSSADEVGLDGCSNVQFCQTLEPLTHFWFKDLFSSLEKDQKARQQEVNGPRRLFSHMETDRMDEKPGKGGWLLLLFLRLEVPLVSVLLNYKLSSDYTSNVANLRLSNLFNLDMNSFRPTHHSALYLCCPAPNGRSRKIYFYLNQPWRKPGGKYEPPPVLSQTPAPGKSIIFLFHVTL